MLIKIFSLYIQSLIYTAILVGLADGLWLLLQRLGRGRSKPNLRSSFDYNYDDSNFVFCDFWLTGCS